MRSKRLLLVLLAVTLVMALTAPLLAQERLPEPAGPDKLVPEAAATQTGAPSAPAPAAKREPVKLEGKQALPLRVLARPFSNVYKEKDLNKGTVQENVSAFQPYYVYTRPTAQDIEMEQGWYEVGSDNRGTVVGWMQAQDVFEWKQTMCLAYTHPEGRKPVLMFDNHKQVMDLVKTPPSLRAQKANEYYAIIDTKQIPPSFPVRSVEPKRAVDIAHEFYLLPILEFQGVDMDGREGRVVKLAAVTGAVPDARQGTDLRTNPDFVKQSIQGATEASPEQLSKLKVDVVFVMDTTVSMQPYIEAVLDAIRTITQEITKDKAVTHDLRFGFWAYRDSVEHIPAIEFTTKNFTPDLLQVDTFLNVLGTVKETKVDSVDYPEDVFSGVNDAVLKTKWTEGAIKIIILAGDAPSHPLGHPWNASRQSEQTLRNVMNDHHISLYALHIKAPRAAQYHEPAEIQFKELSRNPGMGGASAYLSTISTNVAGFTQAAQDVAELVKFLVADAKKGQVSQVATSSLQPAKGPAGTAPAQLSEREAGKELARQMLKAALVQWVGQQTEAKAPRDIVAWATDKDLVDPAISSLEVRLLINKRQLDSLKTVLTSVMAAGRRGQVGGDDFFNALQATAATAARDPNLIKNAKIMAETGLIPEFLVGLPYRSKLMAMSNQLWGSWSVDEQDEFLNELDAKIKAYEVIHDRPEGWIALNQGDDPDQHVYPVSLELLP
jgi:hypothetical protein